MKIVQINAVYGEKSTGVIVKDIDEEAKKQGIDTYIGYQKSNMPVPNGIKIGNKFDWKYHALFTRLTGLQGYASIFSTIKFIKKLNKIKPDIIHLHNLHANYINLKILLNYCAKNNIKTMLTLHDCFFFTGKCFHFFDIGCEKYKTGCCNCPKKKCDIPNYTVDTSSKVWKDKKNLFQNIPQLKVVGCSKWISDLASSSDIFNGKQVIAISNGVDTETFNQKDRQLRKKYDFDKEFVIMCMANKWFEPKNQNITKNIVENLGVNERILLVGCSNEQKEKYNNNNKIVTLGYLSNRNELAEIYSISDVFVNLSLIDNLPTVNMESICCGTPVICYSDCGGGEELIEPGMTGFVIEKMNYTQLIEKIEYVKSGIISRQTCSESGLNSFSNKKSYKKYIKEYLEW